MSKWSIGMWYESSAVTQLCIFHILQDMSTNSTEAGVPWEDDSDAKTKV